MAIKKNEFLRMTPLTDEHGQELVDIRIWKRTPTGGMPTKTAVVIEQAMLPRMIFQMQALFRELSSVKARAPLSTDHS